MSSSNLCDGCLSSDRKLVPVGNHEKLYQQLLLTESKSRAKINLLLCWECKRILENIHKFRLRITEAQRLLNSTALIEQSLSTLKSTTKINDYRTIIYEEMKEKIPLEIEVEVKHEKEEYLDSDDKFDISIDDAEGNIEIDNKGDFFDDLKEEVKYEEGLLKIKVHGVKTEVEDIPILIETKNKNTVIKKRIRGHGVLPMKYRTIIMSDIKDKAKLYNRVNIDHATVMQWMEKKKKSTSKKKFQCDRCYCGFARQQDFDRHLSLRHAKSLGRYECDICGVRFPDRRSMSSHIAQHYMQFVCKLCDEAFYKRGDIYLHYDHGPHKKMNECRKCGMRFDCRQRNQFFEHHRTLHEQFVCDYCGLRKLKKHLLERHIYYYHTKNYCKKCDQRFKNLNALEKHNRRKHEVDATEHNYCVECNMQFKNSMYYNEHLKTSVKHRPNPVIPCPECGKIYTKKSNMTNHFNLVHRKITKHYCAPCDTYYLNGWRLRYHQKYFHEKRPKRKDKMCTYCGKGFSTNRILENHIRTHTGERPFACLHCTAAFSQKQALTSHVKSAHK